MTIPTATRKDATLHPDNPLSRPWPLDLGLPDFRALRPEHIEPAVRVGMAEQRAQWEAVASDPSAPTIANTLEPLERSGELLDRALTVLYSLTSATDCPELDELEERLAPELSQHSDAYDLDPRLYRRFKLLHQTVEQAQVQGIEPRDADARLIDPPTARLIRLAVESFERDGVALQGQAAQRLREINARLSALSTSVGTHMAKAMHEAGVANYTLPPELATITSHSARQTLLEKSLGRGLSGEHDVRAAVLEEAALRAERAQLLGFPHHAATVAAASAAGSTEAISAMLQRLSGPAMANAAAEAKRYAARMAADPHTRPGEVFGPADWSRYEEAERKERFGVDDATLAPYLELWQVVERGVFYAANKLYGLTFQERPDLAEHMYAPGMRVWEVRDTATAAPGQEAPVLALFVGDYYAREGKSGGAWMDNLVEQSQLTGQRPVIINCLNISQPAAGPTLLTWDEVITCFHEFGHALHSILSNCHWPSASGTNVPQDVVELPSQLNEIWALHPTVLASYARHVDTGEALPAELAEQLRAQGSFGQAYATTEYLGAALLDQAWHTQRPEQLPTDPTQVEAFEQAALREAGIDAALVPPRYRSTYFQHAFAGGYAAAYYAYIWSEIMVADAAQWLRTDGQGAQNGDLGLNRQAGDRLRRELLSRGDSRDPLDSYLALTGRTPSLEPLLERRGLAGS
ncbi:Peptidyl-dipeptidase dcp [Actinomyces bovis]|uniref:Peptidyl-dipeptidase dcp n=1 Tax=Actinomyces bovis TaxID=1658 RepID=A0ABY1VJX9_9ACTO|nr:M3 family metallopeptidase [Actinomyces bovis]SPT52414.1 Peptidyl-dipeptidase dcp [Actinomyces bovis]VEG54036.1 Peptidyl-dipeptidase dcp [Actinomyces israelii]